MNQTLRFLCDWIVTSWRENNNFEATLPVGALFSVCGEDLGEKVHDECVVQ